MLSNEKSKKWCVDRLAGQGLMTFTDF